MAEKKLSDYKKELKELESKLKGLDPKSGEASRTRSRIDVIKNVMKRFKTPAREALLAGAKDAGVVKSDATEAPKVGRGSKGRPAKFARYAPIIDPKTGRVNLGQARYLVEKGVITKSELAQFEKLALTRNARNLPEAERGPSVKGSARYETTRPGVSVSGPEDKPRENVGKSEKPKTSTKSNPARNKPSGLTRPSYKVVGSDGRVNIAVAKKAYDDGVIDKSEFQEYKKRAMSQARAAARGEKKPGTAVVRRPGSEVVRRPGSEVVLKSRGAVELPSAKDLVRFAKSAGSKAEFLSKVGKVAGTVGNIGVVYDVVTNPDFGAAKIDAWAKRNPRATTSERFLTSVRNAANMDLKPSKARLNEAAAKRAGKLVPADRGRDKGARPYTEGRRADMSDRKAPVVRSPQSGRKVSQNGSVGRIGATGGSYTVKSGDNLWDIAQKNKTTVSALLKANPTIAQRRKAGKVDIYSGSKVRIPGKK